MKSSIIFILKVNLTDGSMSNQQLATNMQMPRYKEVKVKGKTVKLKYCFTVIKRLYSIKFGKSSELTFLFKVQDLSTTAGVSLQCVRQLRGKVRPSLSLGGQLCGQTQLPLLLFVPHLVVIALLVHNHIQRGQHCSAHTREDSRRSHQGHAGYHNRNDHLFF